MALVLRLSARCSRWLWFALLIRELALPSSSGRALNRLR